MVTQEYQAKSDAVGDKMRLFEKQITLQILDSLWKEHLGTMDHLRQGIFLRSYGGKNPRQEYKREAFTLFQELMSNLQVEVVKMLSQVRIRQEDAADSIDRQREAESGPGTASLQTSGGGLGPDRSCQQRGRRPAPLVARYPLAPPRPPPPNPARSAATNPKVGRNAPLPLRLRQKIQTMSRTACLNAWPATGPRFKEVAAIVQDA